MNLELASATGNMPRRLPFFMHNPTHLDSRTRFCMRMAGAGSFVQKVKPQVLNAILMRAEMVDGAHG